MSERPSQAIGQPAEDPSPEGDADFAGEHDDTAVDEKITSGRDEDRESEAPQGWSGLESGGAGD